MKNHYHSFHHHYELLVQESPSNQYWVVMKLDRVTPPTEIVLHEYRYKDMAITAATIFPELYQFAQVKGFTLEDKYFVNSQGKSIHISFAMESTMTLEQFRAILDR